jgi:threonine dehydrogenase-like Zn-dependent dehydrogenase
MSVQLREEPVGPPGDDELRVRSVVSLISPGPEMRVVSPYQLVGRVEAAGSSTRHTVGDLVFVRHPHQDVFAVRDDPALVFAIPGDLAPERAVFANLVDLAVSAVHDAPIRIGDAVVVYGGGTVGSLCAQLARATAGTVTVVDRYESRRGIALEWGADAALDPREAPAAIRDLTAGRGADVSIEATGTPGALQAAIEATGQEGTVVAVTFFGSQRVPLRLSPEFHYRRHRMVSTQVSSVGAGLQPRWSFARRMGVVLELLRSERVHVRATHTFPFDRAPEAYRLADAQPNETMGIVLEYGVTRRSRPRRRGA